MKRTLFCLVLLGNVGCMNVQPIGPFAKMMKPVGAAPDSSELKPIESDPVTVAAPRPVPPTILITPGEVTPENASTATRKLMDEYEYDRKTLTPPRTAEISVYKGGVKQE